MVSHTPNAPFFCEVTTTPRSKLLKTPRRVYFKRNKERLIIEWQNRCTSVLSVKTLREYCPCQACTTQKKRGVAMTPDSSRFEAFITLGDAGLHITFEKEQHPVIYPWKYLNSMVLNVSHSPRRYDFHE